MWPLPLLLLLMVVVAGHDFDDDDLSYSLNRLYQDSEDAMDPHDMLTRPGEKKYPRHIRSGAHGSAWVGSGAGEDDQGGEGQPQECHSDERVSEELAGCLDRLGTLQNSLQEEQIASLQLQKMLAKEGILDLKGFYRRAVQHLWNTLRLQEGQEVLRDGNAALLRQVTVRVTQDDLEGLATYLDKETEPHKVDEFLERGFTLADPPDGPPDSLLHTLHTLAASTLQTGKSLEVWLVVLCVGFLALGLWAVVLFVRDIQRELRWGRVLGMMATVVFFICCLWHWRHMYKLAESKRHAQLAKRGYAGIPEECQPGAAGSNAGVYDWVKVNIFGSPDICERYFEELMIDAIEEITPGMVIAETLSRFIFQPLQHLGTESAKLTTNFYKNVPVAYHLHATVLFLGLLIIVLFYTCAYGIDFPLGLGGFRPMTRPDMNPQGGDLEREALEQLKRDREVFLEESRRMLSDISRASVGWQAQHQPLVVASSNILEAQLERLISRHLHRAMDQAPSPPPPVRTITSTPLRSEGRAGLQEPEAAAPSRETGELGDFSSSSEGTANGSSTALLVSTDAVHRRLADTPPVSVLPPRTSRSSSRSSSTKSSPSTSEANTPSSSQLSSPASRRQKANKFFRMFRSAEGPISPPSPVPSSSASAQSLTQAGLDEPDLGVPPDSDSFLAEVRSILDLSANSGHSSPPSSNGAHCRPQT